MRGVMPFLLGALGAVAAATPAAGQRPAPIELVWPLPPESPRIRYVGSLSTDRDAGKKPSTFGRISRALVGTRTQTLGLRRPVDVYAEESTHVYVSDGDLGKVVVFDLARREVRLLGADGPGKLGRAMGMSGDGRGRVYVADPATQRVVVFGRGGEFVRAFGGRGALLNPVDVAVDSAGGRVYVVDSYLHQVVVFDTGGAIVGRIGRTAANPAAKLAEDGGGGPTNGSLNARAPEPGPRDAVENRGSAPGEFRFPVSAAVTRGGTLYVSDGLNFRIQVFDRAGRFLRAFGRLGDTPGSFARPKGIATDAAGHVYVVDAAFNNVQVFDGEGRLLIVFGRAGHGAGEFWLPLGVAVDRGDRVYVADRYNNRTQVFQYVPVPGLPATVVR